MKFAGLFVIISSSLWVQQKMSPAECEKTCQKNNLKLIDNSKLYAQWQTSLNVPDVNLGADFQKLILETKMETEYRIWKTGMSS